MKLYSAMLAALFAMSCSQAQLPEPKPGEKAPEKAPEKVPEKKPKLDIGDAAPAIKVSKWLQGTEVKEFAKDKVYIVEFWATWCGPCIRAMPHLAEMQKQYAKQGLVVIGFTSKDESGNDLEKVTKFVEKNGKKFDYAFAYSEGRETDVAYMESAGQEGIPCSFVIGKDGKIAFIGHPMELDDVIPAVLDGTWKGKESVVAIKKANDDLEAIMATAQKEPAKALGELEGYAKKYPNKAKNSMFGVQRMVLTMQAKKFDEAKVLAEAMIAESTATKNGERAAFAGMILADKTLNPDKKHMDLAVKAIDLALQFETKDLGLLVQAANIYSESGDKAKAASAAQKALDLADDAATKKEVEKLVGKFIEKK